MIDRMEELQRGADALYAQRHVRPLAADRGPGRDVRRGCIRDGAVKLGFRLYDMTLGKRYFRRWMLESVDALAGALQKR